MEWPPQLRSHSVEQRHAGCRRPVVGGRWPNPAKKYKCRALGERELENGSCFPNDELETLLRHLIHRPRFRANRLIIIAIFPARLGQFELCSVRISRSVAPAQPTSMSDVPAPSAAAPPAAAAPRPATEAAAPTESQSGPAVAAAAPAPEVGAAAAAAASAPSNDAPAPAALKADSAMDVDANADAQEEEEVDDEEAMLLALEAEKAEEEAHAPPPAQSHDASAAPKLLQDAIKKAEVKFSDSEEEEAAKAKAGSPSGKEEKKDDDEAAAASGVHARVRFASVCLCA